MQHYKAVLFDFDYTLADATEAIVTGFQYAFAQMGLPKPEREAIRHTVGHMLSDEYVMLSGDSDPAHIERFRALYHEKAFPIQAKMTVLFPGAVELLQALHEAGIFIAVVSSKRTSALNQVLEARGLASLFSAVVGGDRVNTPKPHPEGLLATVAALGLTPAEVLFCGDTIIDAETAQRAGAPFCAVLNGTTKAEAFAAFPSVHISPDLWDLKEFIGV